MFSSRAYSLATTSSRLCQLGVLAKSFTSSCRRAQLADGDLKSVKGLFDLKGRNYVVTGGGRGIGYAVVRAIAEHGGNVSVLDLAPEPVKDYETLASKFGVKTKYIQTDVTREDSIANAFEEHAQEFGTLDGCVTAAGICVDGPFVDQTWKTVSRIFDVNVLGTFFSAQAAARQLIKQGTGGSIVLIASLSGYMATPNYNLSSYNASKGAVKMLGTALGTELGPKNIRVNSISPGFIDTEMLTPLKAEYPERVEVMNTFPPLKRIGNRNDLTPAIVYLLSDAAAYTTGSDLLIDGGMHGGRIET